MVTSFRNRAIENTLSLPSIEQMREEQRNRPAAKENKTRPQTAVGTMGALAAAERRLKELESRSDPQLISVEQIAPNPWQPRRVFDEEALEGLQASILEIGLIQPIVLRRIHNESKQFEIVVGERRWRAHQLLGLEEIKGFVIDLSDEEMAVWSLSENMAREDLSDYEIFVSIDQVQEQFSSRKSLAESLGISRAQLYRYLAFKKLPEFVLETLHTENPFLLGSNAVSSLQYALEKTGDKGLEVLKKLWPDFVAGKINQQSLPILITQKAAEPGKEKKRTQTTTRLLQEGKVAGHIKRDDSSLTIKLKTDQLTSEHEKKLLDLIEEIYQTAQ